MKLLLVALFVTLTNTGFSQIDQMRAIYSCYMKAIDGKVSLPDGNDLKKNNCLITLNLNANTITFHDARQRRFSIRSSKILPGHDGISSVATLDTVDENDIECSIEIDLYDHKGKDGSNVAIFIKEKDGLTFYTATIIEA